MPHALRWTLLLALAALSGCRLEDHTPRGSRQDQVEIQRIILTYHRSRPRVDPAGDPSPGELRVVRMDLRQEGHCMGHHPPGRRGPEGARRRARALRAASRGGILAHRQRRGGLGPHARRSREPLSIP